MVLLKGYRSVQVNENIALMKQFLIVIYEERFRWAQVVWEIFLLPFTNLFEIHSSNLAMKRLGSNFAVIDKVFPF